MENNTSIESIIQRESFPNLHKIKNFEQLDDIRQAGDSESVEMGEIVNIDQIGSDTIYSYGANPCISGIIQTLDNHLFMFHSVAEELTHDQIEIIKNAKSGIIGGEINSLNLFKSEFPQNNFKIIFPPNKKSDFNLVFIKYNNPSNVASGVYYCYDQLNY